MAYTKGFQEWEGIDPFIVKSLFKLPIQVATGEPILPLRTIIRGADIYDLPSGQDLARAMGIEEDEILAVSKGNLVFQSIDGIAPQPDLDLLNAKFGESTPLFYYILMEAWVYGDSNSLGPLGSVVVGGVMLNLMILNQDSYLNNEFSPVRGLYGCVKKGEYYMNNLITYTQDLPRFDEFTIIPDAKTNFFDQHKVGQFKVGFGVQHLLQPTVQPDLIREIAANAFSGLTIDQFDITLILGTATQDEVNKVALNALSYGIESIYAVVQFIANKNIQAIGLGLLEPFANKIPRPIVNSPFVLAPEIQESIIITQSQLRARALNKTINDSLRITQEEALGILSKIENEINQALLSKPPCITPLDFLFGDSLIN